MHIIIVSVSIADMAATSLCQAAIGEHPEEGYDPTDFDGNLFPEHTRGLNHAKSCVANQPSDAARTNLFGQVLDIAPTHPWVCVCHILLIEKTDPGTSPLPRRSHPSGCTVRQVALQLA